MLSVLAGIYQLEMMSLSAMSLEIITNLHIHLDDTLCQGQL